MKSIDEYRIGELKAEVAKAYKRLHALEAQVITLADEWGVLSERLFKSQLDEAHIIAGIIRNASRALRRLVKP